MISAPGKVLLLGDYGVLAGGWALVAAVNRYATGRIDPECKKKDSPVIAAVRALEDGLQGPVTIDTSAFRHEGQKIGIGSSSATAVIAAALATKSGGEETLRLAVSAHRRASGGTGSGVDVAACFHGGVIASKRQPAEVIPLASRIAKLNFSVLLTDQSAKTKPLVEAVERSKKWPEYAAILKRLTDEGIKAWERGQPQPFLSVVARYGRAMAALGRDAGVEIVTGQLQAIMDLAAEAGGAAKPSGAGGGDIAVIWSADVEAAGRVAERAGATLLDLEVSFRGLKR